MNELAPINNWDIATDVAKIGIPVIVALSGAVVAYFRLVMKGMITDFMNGLTERLDATYVRKGVLRAAENERRHSEMVEATRVGVLEERTEMRLAALERGMK